MTRSSPAPAALGRVIEPVYRAVVARKNRAFDAGRGVHRIDAPVISIGNLSVGGTGKTPMVMWIVDRLLEMHRWPAIAMRGYGAKRAGVSDEQAEYQGRFPELPIVAQPDRIAGLREVRTQYDCVVLDDGFQHRQLARDLDIVLIDATRDVFADRCLPAGWLREPVESLARADAVILTRSDLVDGAVVGAMEARVRTLAPGATVARAAHAWREVAVTEADGSSRAESAQWVRGKRVVVACGIANPDALVAQVRGHGAEVADTVMLRDHAAWTDADVSRVAGVARRADAVVVTGKDWVKLRDRRMGWGIAVVRPRVEMDLGSGTETIAALLETAIGARSAGTMPA